MSEKKEIIRHIDKTQITAVKFKFPDLMSDNSEQMVRECYHKFLDAQNALYDARDKVRECEAGFEKAKEEWNKMLTLADIEFLTVEEEKVTAKSNSMFFNGFGNSCIGYDNH